MSRKIRLEIGALEGEPKMGPDGSWMEKPVKMVYAGKFKSMDGDVEIKDEDIDKLISNHNSLLAKVSRMAKGSVPVTSHPPIQLDHSTSATHTVGRLVGDLTPGEHIDEDGNKFKALMGTARILGKDNVERVQDGRWATVSIGADLEEHKVTELSITPFPAAAGASMLARLHKDVSYMEHEIRVYPSTKDGTGKWRWETKWHSGLADSEADAVAAGKKCIDEFHEYNPELRAWMGDIKRMKGSDIALPGHPDEALWNKAKDAYEKAQAGGSKIDDKWAFVTAWYKKQGGKLSQGEDTMGYKEHMHKASLYEKARKHLTDHKKMGEEDADKHLEAADERELKHLNEEHDKHMKHLADEDAKKKEEEEKLKGKLSFHKDGLIKLAKGFKESGKKVQLAEKASKIHVRLTKLRADAKISPAEMKSINIDSLAEKSEEVIEAKLSSYESRQPVIDTGLVGSTKAMTPAQLAKAFKVDGLTAEEVQTRLNMPSKREGILKRLAEVGDEAKKHQEHREDDGAHLHDGDNDEDDKHLEAALTEYKKMSDEGKHDEAKEHLKSYMKKARAKHLGEQGAVSDPTPAMSALAAEVKSMQNSFIEFVKLTAPAFGATVEELI